MTSTLYQRTELGNLELDNRQHRLTARQRALLLLVESTKHNSLIQQQLQSLATPDNIQALMSYALIVPTEPVVALAALESYIELEAEHIKRSEQQVENDQLTQTDLITADQIGLRQWEQRVIQQNQAQTDIPPEALSFEQIKNLMVNSLKSYCGLLGFGLMRDIQQASRMAQLRMCQMQWVTLLSESKADAMQVKHWVSQLNYSYQQLNKD